MTTATRTASEILREYYAIEAKIIAGEKGQTALKAYARKLHAEYTRALGL